MNWEEFSFALQRPIAFHRLFAEVGGGALNGLFLSQAFYWTRVTKDPDGWFWKTRDEWTEETGMDRKEQEEARRALKYRGIIEEQKRGVPCKVWFRLNKTKLLELLKELSTTYSGSSLPVGNQCANQSGRSKTYESKEVASDLPIENSVQTSRSTGDQLVGDQLTDQLGTSAPTNTETTSETTPQTTKETAISQSDSSNPPVQIPPEFEGLSLFLPGGKCYHSKWTPEFFNNFDRIKEEWNRNCPSVDIKIELGKAHTWCFTEKKVRKNLAVFLTSWMNRAQSFKERNQGGQGSAGSKGQRTFPIDFELQRGFEERSPKD